MSTAAPGTQHSDFASPTPTRKGPSVGTWRPWAVLPWALALLALPLIALALRSNFGANGWMTVIYMVFGALPHELVLVLMVGSLFLLPRVNPQDEQRGGIRLGRLLHTLLGISWGSFALASIIFPTAATTRTPAPRHRCSWTCSARAPRWTSASWAASPSRPSAPSPVSR